VVRYVYDAWGNHKVYDEAEAVLGGLGLKAGIDDGWLSIGVAIGVGFNLSIKLW